MSKTIRIIACGSKKNNGSHAAKDLYVGGLFNLAKRWAEQSPDEWGILSAKHGLLKPTDVIESYDLTFKKAPFDWIVKVNKQLREYDKIYIAAPHRYVEHFMPDTRISCVFQEAGCSGIGYQQQWLKENISG